MLRVSIRLSSTEPFLLSQLMIMNAGFSTNVSLIVISVNDAKITVLFFHRRKRQKRRRKKMIIISTVLICSFNYASNEMGTSNVVKN